MSHKRQIIRDAIINQLNDKTDAGSNVYGNRAKPLFDQSIPAILVYSKQENILEDQYNIDGYAALKRDLEIAIEAVIIASDEFDQKLDDIASQIESALDGFEITNRKADLIKLKSTEIDYSIEGSKIYGAVRLTYSVIYRTEVKQPDNSGTPITEIESNL
jgi:hypothetical protein